ncbi:MAG: AAA family ATPase [Kofleriaceae bacterium]|nr:AAA family ATPase [Kofleriaceae bacterium]
MVSSVSIGVGRLVGRERERLELTAAVDEARRGRGRVVLITGDAGIGRTRLCEEVEAYARAQGFATFWGHGVDDAPPYWPWIQLIRGFVRTCMTPDIERALGPAIDDLAFFLPSLRRNARVTELSPDDPAALHRLVDAVLMLVRAASAAQPLVLLLDDLHAADVASVKLLEFLALEIHDAPLLVIGSYREAEAGVRPAVGKLLSSIGRRATTIALKGLDAGAMAEIMRDVTGLELDDNIVKLLCRRAGGNPLFVRELARYLRSSSEDDAFARAIMTIPHAIGDLIVGRLGLLSPAAKAVVLAAAVAGMEVEASLLAAICRLEPAECLSSIEEAVRIGLAAPGANGIAFSQALVRQAIYRSIPVAERARLHHAFAVVAAPSYEAAAEPRFAELAHHFAQGASFGGWDKVVHYERLAGEHAAKRLAFDEAVVHFSRAHERSAKIDPEDRCELLMVLSDALLATGESARAVEALVEAAEIARAHGRPRLLARFALRAGRRGSALRHSPQFVQLCQDALDRLGDDEPALRAQLLARLAATRPSAERTSMAMRALAIARSVDDPAALADTLLSAYHVLDGAEYLQERLAIASQAEELASGLHRRDLVLESSDAHYLALVELDDLAGAERELSRCALLARELRSGYYEWLTRTHEAALALARGDLADAERLADEGYRLGERAGATREARVRHLLLLWRLRRRQNRLSELASRALEMIAVAPEAPIWRVLLAQSRLAAKDESGARELLGTIDADGLPRDELWLGTLVGLAEIAIVLGDLTSMSLVRDRLAPFAGRNAILGRGAALIAPVTLTLEQLDVAIGKVAGGAREPTPTGGMIAVEMELSGSEWIVRWGGVSVSIADSKGSRYLAELVRHPDRELHVAELAMRAAGMADDGEAAGPEVDAVRSRVEELMDVLGEAEQRQHLARANAARESIERLTDEMLASRTKRTGPDIERLRQSVTKRLRDAIKKIGAKDALLGRHLSQALRTGTTCIYSPLVTPNDPSG